MASRILILVRIHVFSHNECIFYLDTLDTGLNSSTRRSSESSVVEQGRQPCSHMLYQHNIGLHAFPTGSYLMGGGMQPIPSTSPSATSGSTEPLQQLYDEMYNVDAPSLVPLPGTFSPLPPSSPTPTTTLGVSHSASSRRFSYPNSPVHISSVSNNGPQTQTTKNNTPQISAEPTSNIAAVVAAAEQALNTSNQPLQISKHFQQLRLHHGGKGGEINVPSSSGVYSTWTSSDPISMSSPFLATPSSPP